MDRKVKTVILAAGMGTRMKSEKPKCLHEILGYPMLHYIIEASKKVGCEEICVVIGHKGEMVMEALQDTPGITFVQQKEQLGTGHAVMQASKFIEGEPSDVLVLCGDTPLVQGEVLERLLQVHQMEKNAVTVLSTIVENPTGYGRIVRDAGGNFLYSVEQRDATEAQRKIQEVNSGMYCFQSEALLEALAKIDNQNSQGEYYLPDAVPKIMEAGGRAEAAICEDSAVILGVNDRMQLLEATQIMQKRINRRLMAEGVTLLSMENTYVSPHVRIGRDTVLYPGTFLEGNTHIGEHCVIGPNSRIVDCTIGDHVTIQNSTLLDSTIQDFVNVGPFAYVRPGSVIGPSVKVGDFVEIKNSVIGEGTKISHLTYVGDADVGKNINFGCGTVLVNYDGKEKHRSVIEDHAFIGCNTNLVSPVRVGEGAFIAAGSTITSDVPPDALGIARARQVNKEDWVQKRGKR